MVGITMNNKMMLSQIIDRCAMALALAGLAILALSCINHAHAGALQMLPPTPVGSLAPACPPNTMLMYSGATTGQAAINCVPVSSDSTGNLVASGQLTATQATLSGSVATNGTVDTANNLMNLLSTCATFGGGAIKVNATGKLICIIGHGICHEFKDGNGNWTCGDDYAEDNTWVYTGTAQPGGCSKGTLNILAYAKHANDAAGPVEYECIMSNQTAAAAARPIAPTPAPAADPTPAQTAAPAPASSGPVANGWGTCTEYQDSNGNWTCGGTSSSDIGTWHYSGAAQWGGCSGGESYTITSYGTHPNDRNLPTGYTCYSN